MLAAMGHDLRSPLTAIRVRAEMVDDEETRESLTASVEEMHEMVEATLNFARGLSKNEPVQNIDLLPFLQLIMAGMVADFEIIRGPDQRVRIRPNAMKRALKNVIENALRYGKIASVEWSIKDGDVLISVTDNGPGLPDDALERVFDPFFRLDESRSLETGGHGLGLSIARSIIRAHGGNITLSNREIGGLEVIVRLPISQTKTSNGD